VIESFIILLNTEACDFDLSELKERSRNC